MNCELCRRLLLTSESPRQPGPEVEAHLSECQSCRDWQGQLLRIEANVPRLPVPFSDAKGLLLQRLLRGPVFPPAPPWWRRRRVLAYAGGGAAAAVLLLAAGLLVGSLLSRPGRQDDTGQQARQGTPRTNPQPPQTAAPTLVARLLDCDLRLAEADGARQRVQSLADLADQLSNETKALAHVAGREDLDALAGMYGRVVREGMVPRARGLAPAERRPVLEPVLARLAQAKRDMEQLARQAGPDAAVPLQQIAEAAHHGDTQLRDLMKEEG